MEGQGLQLEHEPVNEAPVSGARPLLELQAAPSRKPQPHRRGSYQRTLEREGRASARWEARHRERMVQRGIELKHAPPAFKRHTVVTARAMLADSSSQLARKKLRQLSRIAPAYVAAIVKAAIGPSSDGCKRDWQSPRARKIAVLGWAYWMESARARRKGRWRRCVKGLVESCFAALLEDPFSGRRPARTTLAGRSFVGASLELGGLGYLRALEAAGALYRQQLPVDQVDRSEIFLVVKRDAQGREYTEERSSNRYWLDCSELDNGHQDDAERSTLQKLVGLASLMLNTGRLLVRPRTKAPRPFVPTPTPSG